MNRELAWTTRPETEADAAAVRAVNLAAFPTSLEADIVEGLRADPAWIPGLSLIAEDPDGTVAGHALLTRCLVDDAPALALGPCAVLPGLQRTGCGSAVIQAALAAARVRGERLVLVLGHPSYYPRFGFVPASRYRIGPTFEVPDDAMMALALDPARPVPSGTLRYPAPFGVPDERSAAPADALFAYGSLRFPDVLRSLLGRVPQGQPASAPGWRAAALRGRVYPGLVPAAEDTAATGLLLTGLTERERRILDVFEGDEYELRQLPLAGGRAAWTYVWRGADVLPADWSADRFRTEQLADFVARFTATP